MRMSQGEPFPRSRGLKAASPAATRRKSRDRNRVSETHLRSGIGNIAQDYTPQRMPGSRFRTQKRRGAGRCTCPLPRKSGLAGLLLDAVLQGLSCVECRETGCCDLDALSSLGVPTLACLPLAGLEGA